MMKTYKVTLSIFGNIVRDTIIAENKKDAIKMLYRPYFIDMFGKLEGDKANRIISNLILKGVEIGIFEAKEIPKLKKNPSYYVSIYSLYPIYEPAEGGYYYPGSELHESRSFQNRKDAIRYINKLYKHLISESNKEKWYENSDHTYFGEDGKYIGEGWFVVLERKLGIHESGRVPYC